MTLYKWSQTASADATADSTINWSEGQAPSSINDSARAMMAATAKYRDDISGAIITAGTGSAYTVTSYQQFDTLAHLNGQMIAFTPHVTNAGVCTLDLDNLGARPLRSAPNAELPGGTIIQGTPYIAVYNQADGVFYLHGFYGTPYNIPIGAGIEYWSSMLPNSSFAFAYGQAISRTTYATLFSLFGTSYGAGDGATTFNIPDVRGRVRPAADLMGPSAAGRLTSTYYGGNPQQIGAVGGSDNHLLTVNEMPSHNHPNGIVDNGHSHSSSHSGLSVVYQGANSIGITGSSALQTALAPFGISSSTSNIGISNGFAGGNQPHSVVQPSITCSYVIRII